MADLDRIKFVIETLPGAHAQVSVNIPTPHPGMRLATPAHALAIDALGWLGKQPAVAGFVYAPSSDTHDEDKQILLAAPGTLQAHGYPAAAAAVLRAMDVAPPAAPVAALDLESVGMPANPYSAAGEPGEHVAWAQGAGAVFAAVETALAATPAASPKWYEHAGDLGKKGQLVITLENINDGKHWHATTNHFDWMVSGYNTAQDALRIALEKAGATPAAGVPSEPMDWPLPCDVKVGHVTMCKGVPLRTLVLRMKGLYQMATGSDADEVAARTPEQRRQMLAAFQARIGAITPAGVPAAAPDALTQAARDVLAERARQVAQEGYDTEHDDSHVNDEIAAMAALFVMPEAARDWDTSSTGYGRTLAEAMLPPDWNHPRLGDRRDQLVKGAAMALAEIERIDRAAQASKGAAA